MFDDSVSVWNPQKVNALRYVERLHSTVTYRQVFLDDGVYVFRRR